MVLKVFRHNGLLITYVTVNSMYMAIFTISGVKHSVCTNWCITFLQTDRYALFFSINLPPTMSTLGTLMNVTLLFFQMWQALTCLKSITFGVLALTQFFCQIKHFKLFIPFHYFCCCYDRQVSNIEYYHVYQVLLCLL